MLRGTNPIVVFASTTSILILSDALAACSDSRQTKKAYERNSVIEIVHAVIVSG